MATLQYGVNVAPFGALADPNRLAALAAEAEAAGWDSFFLWDHLIFDDLFHPLADPWIALAAAALRTRRLRLGTMITPLARRRPWQVARQAATLDHLSGGRVILGVGLGEPALWEFGFFGEETENRIRAAKLDEGLALLDGLWRGEPFRFQGTHYQIEEVIFRPRPVQQPRIPVWVGGTWPHKPPLRRAARWDGVYPVSVSGPLTPDDWRDLLAYVRRYRTTDGPFEAVGGGITPGDDRTAAAAIVAPYVEAGITWWIEDTGPQAFGLDWGARDWPDRILPRVEARIRQGPPRL